MLNLKLFFLHCRYYLLSKKLIFFFITDEHLLAKMIRSLLTSLLVGCLELVGTTLGAELDSASCLQLGFNPAKVGRTSVPDPQ